MENDTIKHLTNLKIVLDVIDKKIVSKQPEEVLDKYFQPCGTCGCIAGDTYIAMGLMNYDDVIDCNGNFDNNTRNLQFGDWLHSSINIFGSNMALVFLGEHPDYDLETRSRIIIDKILEIQKEGWYLEFIVETNDGDLVSELTKIDSLELLEAIECSDILLDLLDDGKMNNLNFDPLPHWTETLPDDFEHQEKLEMFLEFFAPSIVEGWHTIEAINYFPYHPKENLF